jgi:acetyl-CoA C-acetyltransferase
MLALIFDDATVKLWDAASGQELHSLNTTYALGLAFSPDGKTMASNHFEGVTLYDVSSGSQIRTIVLQLREEAGPIQVKGPEIGLVHNIGGVGLYGNVSILGR